MKLTGALMRLAFRPRVTHSLPGRVRIQLPRLARGRRPSPEVVDLVVHLIGVPDEIQQVEGNPVSGSVLVRYDADRITESDVMSYLDALIDLYLRNKQILDAVPADQWPARRQQLAALVRGKIRHRLTMDSNLELDADALA